MKKLFNDRFDITGSEVVRVGKTLAVSKCLPLGNFRGGSNARCLLVLFILHYCSGPIFWLFVRQEGGMRRIIHHVKKLMR